MAIQSYVHDNFANLDLFFAAKELLGANLDTIPKLGNIICKHGVEDIIGVTFLHRHFDISSDERVVRRYNGDNANLSPESPDQDYAACMWKFNNHHVGSCAPVEFSAGCCLDEAHEQEKALRDKPAFLKEFGAAVTEMRVENLFGIATLHGIDAIAPSAEESILEKSADGDRRLTLDRIDLAELQDMDSTETMWIFRNWRENGVACKPPCSNCKTPLHCDH